MNGRFLFEIIIITSGFQISPEWFCEVFSSSFPWWNKRMTGGLWQKRTSRRPSAPPGARFSFSRSMNFPPVWLRPDIVWGWRRRHDLGAFAHAEGKFGPTRPNGLPLGSPLDCPGAAEPLWRIEAEAWRCRPCGGVPSGRPHRQAIKHCRRQGRYAIR